MNKQLWKAIREAADESEVYDLWYYHGFHWNQAMRAAAEHKLESFTPRA